MTVIEAMACALPVVISDQVNIHSEISEAGAGLVTRCDADDVASALLTLLNDPERRHRMGSAGRRRVEDRYSWPVIVQALTREYEGVIEKGRG
jgi:glycosyltransferase involved in cell wall biosynthesis